MVAIQAGAKGQLTTGSFTYNPAGQVASSSSSNPAYDWTAGYTVARGYSVDGQNKYTASGGLALSYDGRGNLANDGVTGFGYDVTNKLTSLSNGATLSYDAADRLAQTTGGSTTRFLYDGQQIIGEYDASGNVLRRYVPGPGTDQPIVWYEGSGTSDRRFLITDRQGSVTAVTNASGGVLAINTYDEAGIPGPNNTGRFQYNAAPFIPEAGLYHMRARAYSPTLGRFMQPDPIGYGDGMNFYNYVHGDPVNGWDPSGMDGVDGTVEEVVVTAPRCSVFSFCGLRRVISHLFGGGGGGGGGALGGGGFGTGAPAAATSVPAIQKEKTDQSCEGPSGVASPITNLIGGSAALAGGALGFAFGTNPGIQASGSALRITNSPLAIGGRSFSIGNFEQIAPGVGANSIAPSYSGTSFNNVYFHEDVHVSQAAALGDYYIPMEIVGSLMGNLNPLETAADNKSMQRMKCSG